MGYTRSLMMLKQFIKQTSAMNKIVLRGSAVVRQKPMLDEHRIFGGGGQDRVGLALGRAYLLRTVAAPRWAVLSDLGFFLFLSAKGVEKIIARSFGDREELFGPENRPGSK